MSEPKSQLQLSELLYKYIYIYKVKKVELVIPQIKKNQLSKYTRNMEGGKEKSRSMAKA